MLGMAKDPSRALRAQVSGKLLLSPEGSNTLAQGEALGSGPM